MKFGIGGSGWARLVDEHKNFLAFDSQAAAIMEARMAEIAERYKQAIVKTWIEHGHNKPLDRPMPAGVQRTIDTIRVVKVSRFQWRVEVGGAFTYVQFGVRPHLIRPHTSRGLIFRGRDGQWVNVLPPNVVEHPGTTPDDILADANEESGLQDEIGSSFNQITMETFGQGHAPGHLGGKLHPNIESMTRGSVPK